MRETKIKLWCSIHWKDEENVIVLYARECVSVRERARARAHIFALCMWAKRVWIWQKLTMACGRASIATIPQECSHIRISISFIYRHRFKHILIWIVSLVKKRQNDSIPPQCRTAFIPAKYLCSCFFLSIRIMCIRIAFERLCCYTHTHTTHTQWAGFVTTTTQSGRSSYEHIIRLCRFMRLIVCINCIYLSQQFNADNVFSIKKIPHATNIFYCIPTAFWLNNILRVSSFL